MAELLIEPRWFFGYDGRYVPEWFFGYDSYLQLIFFLITMVVCIYAFRIYKLSKKKESYLFGLGFFFISLSYFIWAILNLSVISNFGTLLCEGYRLCMVNTIIDISIYIHMLLFIVGLLALSYISLDIKSRKAYSLLSIIVLLVILLSKKTLFFFYLLSSLLLLYLVLHYVQAYLLKRNHKTMLVGSAFGLLFIGSVGLLFGLSGGLYYLLSNIAILIAYLFILFNLMLVLRK